jgi:hypothetical protein
LLPNNLLTTPNDELIGARYERPLKRLVGPGPFLYEHCHVLVAVVIGKTDVPSEVMQYRFNHSPSSVITPFLGR